MVGMKKKRRDMGPHPFPEDMGVTDDKYAEYVREHNAKLRRLQREQAGWNMEEPPQ